MRVLFSFSGGNGHFQPLAPIIEAAHNAGHTILVACTHDMYETVHKAGFPSYVFASATQQAQIVEKTPLQPVDRRREEIDLRELFARQGARKRTPKIIQLCEEWKPDLIVCDEVDFGSMIAAEFLGIPHASVVVIASGSFIRPDVVAEPLDEIRAEYGLEPDPKLKMLSRHLLIVPVPARFRDPAYPLPTTAHVIQPFALKTPRFFKPFDGYDKTRPTLYFTLGTVFNTESGDLFVRVLRALQRVQANVIVTVGKHINPLEFGEQADHIYITQYIPQLDVLPHCDLVISHAGSGTVIGCLAHGVPMVLVPMGADQLNNAERCEALGIAQVLDVIDATSDMIYQAITTTLTNPQFREATQRFKAEIQALPEPASVIPLLERLMSQHNT